MEDILVLCDRVREICFSIHTYLRNGHPEKVYENALINRLGKAGIPAQPQHPLKVYDEDGTELGHYLADFFLENRLIVEIKACKTLVEEHFAQLLGYLRASRIEHGMLVNFGSPKLQVRKFILSRETGE